MSDPNYTLEIISHHPKFNAKALKKYYVDGIETVGAWGDEPFEICFRNNTFQKVQIKLSLDGTDILTGKPADTQVSKDMWVVNGYSSISLKAWPEDNNGGAAFIFTSANNSVAVHTHGDLSSRGIIAAAVYTEGHVEPIRLTYTPSVEHQHHHYHHEPYYQGGGGCYGGLTSSPTWIYNNGYNAAGDMSEGFVGGMQSQTTIGNVGNLSTSVNSCNNASDADVPFFGCVDEIGEVAPAAAPTKGLSARRSRQSLEKLVSVGAGEHVDQKITYVTGLVKPMFAETIRVKYLWWDDLVERLRETTTCQPQPSGFPGDCNHKNIDLKCTPRRGAKKKNVFRRAEQEPVFARF